MNQLVKIRDGILQFFSRYEIYMMAAVRFAIGFAAFRLIIQNTGYMEMLSRYPCAVLLALACCFLPSGLMLFVGAVLILLELYALSMILSLIVAVVFLLMLCAYSRLASRKGLYAVLTPVLSVWGLSYTMPVTAGFLGEPYAVISVICGEVAYFILKHVTANPALFVGSDETGTAGVITLIVTDLLLDREMYLFLIAFAAAAIATYCLCKLSYTLSHLVASAVGVGVEFLLIAVGERSIEGGTPVPRVLLGCVLSFGILLVIGFFTYNVDYSRVENVQFEDDDYYYYVKAIPKVTFSSAGKKPAGKKSSSGVTSAQKRTSQKSVTRIPEQDEEEGV